MNTVVLTAATALFVDRGLVVNGGRLSPNTAGFYSVFDHASEAPQLVALPLMPRSSGYAYVRLNGVVLVAAHG